MNSNGGATGKDAPTGNDAASPGAKRATLIVLFGGLLYCLIGAGLLKWCHAQPFQIDVANFALFAAFIVVAGAIERFLEPLSAILPPNGDKEEEKATRALTAYCIALVVGIAVSSIFGLYFLEAIGVKVGVVVGPEGAQHVLLPGTGDKLVRGLDVFVTALIITGGTKPLHDMITSIEKKKDAIGGGNN